MKTCKQILQSAICLITMSLSGCSSLSEMFKDADKIKYSVTPNPLQDNNDSVDVSISAQYPAKYFNKKAVVTVTPVLKFTDGSVQQLKPVTLVGEKASQNGIRISYGQGGKLSYHDKVAYNSKMRQDELDVNAVITNNKKALPPVKLADGTITTALLVQKDAKPLLGRDNFMKVTAEKDTARIFFRISDYTVSGAEMKKKDMKVFKDFVLGGLAHGYDFKNIDMSAFASPDGETAFNDHLAGNRAKSSIAALKSFFKSLNGKKHNTKFGAEKDFYDVDKTGMDWNGFQRLVKNSGIKDKDLILRVLSMYTNHDQRMKEIKSMAATYVELAKDILPKLRRSIVVLNAEKKSRTDEQIIMLSVAHPDSLSVEELLYSATLTGDVNQKLNIYKTAQRSYPADWRTWSNAAYEEILMNRIDAAESDLTKANQLSANNPVVENNMGIVAFYKGDTKAATDLFTKASAGGPNVDYNIGLIDIKKGNYADASNKMNGMHTFNAALARLLCNDLSGAEATLNESANNDPAAFYLKAIISARMNNKKDMINNLQNAISHDSSFKKMAATDCEFLKFRNDNDFKTLVE